MNLKLNFLAGFASSIWIALLTLAVVPLYLKYLGTEAYGLIGFFATTQVLLQLMDLGLSPTINREVARCSGTGNMAEARSLLHSLSVVYWGMTVIIALFVVLLAPLIAEHWLQAEQLSKQTVLHAIMLMGFVVACRWPVGLYVGVLMGMQKMVHASAISTLMGTLSSLGTVAVLTFVSPTIEAFFTWQAFIGLLYAVVVRWMAWNQLGKGTDTVKFNFKDLHRIWRFSAGVSAVAITGVVLMQLDKVLLSKMLTLEDFGKYTLAAILANGLYVLLGPLFNAIYPRLTALIAAGEESKLAELYQASTRIFLALLFPIAFTAALFSKELIFLWTRNSELAESISLTASFFLVGTAINGAMHFPFALQLAYGTTRIPLIITSTLIVVFVPLIVSLTLHYGTSGGAMAWLILNVAYLFFGTWITHRALLKGMAWSWLTQSVAPPFVISIISIGLCWELFLNENAIHQTGLFSIIMILLGTLMVNLILLPKVSIIKIMQWRYIRP